MRILYHPVFILTFTLAILMFAFSMGKNDISLEENRSRTEILEQKKQTLETRIADLERQVDLASQPLSSERIMRDQLWQKESGEENLELQGFVYTPRQITMPSEPVPTPLENWQTLIFN